MNDQVKGIFVAGTDTEVGKTFISAALMAALRARGIKALYRKLVSTDGVSQEDGGLVSPDAIWVAQACGLEETPRQMNPICLAHALSPLAAARLENADLTWERVLELSRQAISGEGAMVCEGVGGVLAPLAEGHTALDLMAELGLPVLVAARPGLGTINHTLLTIQAVRRRGLEVLGFVFSGGEDQPEYETAGALNSQLIAEFSGAAFLGALPRIPEPDAQALDQAADASLDLRPILKALQ